MSQERGEGEEKEGARKKKKKKKKRDIQVTNDRVARRKVCYNVYVHERRQAER